MQPAGTSAGIATLLATTGPRDHGRPLLTCYDDATGERVDLTAATLGGWAARTANLLVDGCGLGPGHRAAVLLPPDWRTAAILLGAWTAGLSVAFHGWATAGLPSVEPSTPPAPDVVFAAPERVTSWLEDVPDAPYRFVVARAGGASATPDAERSDPAEPAGTPAGYRDWRRAAYRYPDMFHPDLAAPRTGVVSADGSSFREWGMIARGIADNGGLVPGDRVLIDAQHSEHPLIWLLAPLAAGASVVLCTNLDPATVPHRTVAEGVTHCWC